MNVCICDLELSLSWAMFRKKTSIMFLLKYKAITMTFDILKNGK